jgi:hypothetical protein
VGCLPDVVPGHERAEPPRRGDRLQPRDPGAENQHPGRADGAGRGDQHRQEAAVRVGRDQCGFVPGDVGLGGERVHRLRPAERAGKQVEAERGDLGVGQPLRQPGIGERREQADQDLSRSQRVEIVRRAQAQQHVAAGIHLRATGDLCAGLEVGLVVVPGAHPRARLDEHLEAAAAQAADVRGNQCHAPFAGRRLADHADRRHERSVPGRL